MANIVTNISINSSVAETLLIEVEATRQNDSTKNENAVLNFMDIYPSKMLFNISILKTQPIKTAIARIKTSRLPIVTKRI
ncbi:hypothetical protein Q763_09390 [Flavobacterium beibuense F44-8]|uniref:Uncharacterized protein n=1 Tax=Flavobacterium beibuense F44-8 TaxID=1406840 RepID=A0A0A2LNI0_9FLAO|nr:hypothetical protein [Flavobacterium beibuense]KGO80743.1 hypothetical protein Q763_09390 [Flavobacterium beibuense F44-8]